MHSLKFNVFTGGIHQLPQTNGDGIHSLLQEVVWDVGDNGPNLVLQLFHCAWFCPVHLLLCPVPQQKVTGSEICTSCRLFMRSLSSQPKSWKLLIQPGTYTQCKVWWCSIVHENKFIDVFPARYDRPHVILQHMKIAFGIHGVTQKIWVDDDPSGHHSAPHSHFWTILHLFHRRFGIVCRPVMAITGMSTDKTADMENGLVAPENVFKEFWPILVPTQHQLPIFHSAVTVFRCQLLHVMGENSSLSLTPYVPCASTVHFHEQPDVLIYAGCG